MEVGLLSAETQSVLSELGISDVKDVFTGISTHLNLNGAKREIIAHFDIPVSIKKHTWYGLKCHIWNRGHITRGSIEELVVWRTRVMLRVRSGSDIVFVSPLSIISIHVIWLTNFIMSDDEEATDDEHFNSLPKLSIMECESITLLDKHAQLLIRATLTPVTQMCEVLNHIN